MPYAVEVEHLVKRFGQLTAVDGVSFQIHAGEIFGILGPNGAGKTTTLECIEGIQKPTSGRALILGMDTQREMEKVKQRIGVQLQASAYFEYLTLKEILDLFGRFYERRLPSAALLEKMQLQDKARSTIAQLSGGQKQRFTIAATLINDAEVVFLDEPTTGLDPQARRYLWDFIREIHQDGRTVILTTHYMEEAETLCQRVAIMDIGRIVALDTPANLIMQLPVPYRVRFSSDEPLPQSELGELPGVREIRQSNGVTTLAVTEASATLQALLSWADGQRARLRNLEVLTANLEDVFLALTGKQLRG